MKVTRGPPLVTTWPNARVRSAPRVYFYDTRVETCFIGRAQRRYVFLTVNRASSNFRSVRVKVIKNILH